MPLPCTWQIPNIWELVYRLWIPVEMPETVVFTLGMKSAVSREGNKEGLLAGTGVFRFSLVSH